MDLSIYSKSLEDYKNSILEVLDNAYSINTEHFYKPNVKNTKVLSSQWGHYQELKTPLLLNQSEGTASYFKTMLRGVFADCKVVNLDKPYTFKAVVEISENTTSENILKLSEYINKYKNVRSVCENIELITIHEKPLIIQAVMQIKEFKEL
ncbi:hypothetical protein AVBRAN12640_06260 [Campylobacter sp. RM12640]|uniref:hypothetical protein n=2 Tax=unclassified Campylobacter TaxID=2593542 RepID=UPI003014EDC4|nr:hypothetical protein [Campylobacter sp. RM12640]